MDPDAALEEIRRLVKHAGDPYKNPANYVDRLCELVDGLDKWFSKGGFLPKLWKVNACYCRCLNCSACIGEKKC